MPGRRSLCGCLGGKRAPPQISYGVENGGLTLKPMEVQQPIPQDEHELNTVFEELVDELGLDKAHREAMFNLTPEKKWQIYCSQKKERGDAHSTDLPDYYIEKLNAMSSIFFGFDEEEIENRTKQVDSLKTALRTQPMSFVIRFLELAGLNCLLEFLKKMDHTTKESSIHTSVIGCVKALMNSAQGRSHVLAHPSSINIIAQSLRTHNNKTKVAVLEFLGACCLVPGGHRKVLQAMIHYQNYAHERTRFQTLIVDLDRDYGDYKVEISVKTAIMSFINAALNYGPGQNHLEFRLHLRYEFLMLGIIPIFEKLRMYDNATLDRHIDFFEVVRIKDEKEIAKRFELSHVDTRSASSMFELVKKKLNFFTSYNSFLSMLFHLLQMPFGNGQAALQWDLVDKVIQQIVLQTKDGDPDGSPLEVDVKKVVKQLANENAIKEIQNRMRDIQKENDELTSSLKKKERECEVKLEETDELLSTLNKIKTKLEKETSNHFEAKQQLGDLTARFNELQQMLELERAERLKLEHAVKTGSLPDDAKMGVANLGAELAAAKLSFASASAAPPPPPPGAAPPPPPPPPGCPAPPPPPGGGPGLSNGFGLMVNKKNVPKPSQPLKSFNWAKLADNKIKGTVWKEIEDEKLYKHLDLKDFEHNFSAYQKQEDSESLNRSMTNSKTKELSVIDGRRAQNCTILLSKLKMSNQELSKSILNVDSREEIPKDMCEQLLKFVPTTEEMQLLSEHSHEIEEMAKADRFLFEMSRIEHYEERLKALYFKKKFTERMNDAKPKVEVCLQACQELINSRKLRKLLEIVLAYGNYMNRGQRGNAFGFRISSLNKMVDTKSSINRRVTLLHYIISVMEKRFSTLLELEKEIPHIRKAAKVNLGELESDINLLRSGLKDIEKELQYRRKSTTISVPNDKFVTVMSGFVSVATYNFQELEEQLFESKDKFEKVTQLYCEESRASEADVFFGIFDTFLTSFSTAHIENDRFVRDKEIEEKRVKVEAQMKAEREKRATRLNINGDAKMPGQKNEGEFDDLISALRTGDVFGEDIAKLKRVRKRGNGQVAKRGESRERVVRITAN